MTDDLVGQALDAARRAQRDSIVADITEGRAHPSEDVIDAVSGWPVPMQDVLIAMWNLGMDDAAQIAKASHTKGET